MVRSLLYCTVLYCTHIPVVVRPADGQEPLDGGAHHEEDGAAHRDPEYQGGGEAGYRTLAQVAAQVANYRANHLHRYQAEFAHIV